MDYLWLVLGGVVLTLSADQLLIKGAAHLSLRFGIPPLVVGLTVLAWGTSAPEAAVSVADAVEGNGAIALGNVVGSNIFNILGVLGISALVAALTVSRSIVSRDMPWMLAATAMGCACAWDGAVTRWEGAVLLSGMVLYTLVQVRASRARPQAAATDAQDDVPEKPEPVWASIVRIVLGLAGLILGSHWFVGAAASLARSWHVSELVIGLTIVAAGTSLPELVTSIVAGLRGQRDMALGNIVGSNIANIFGVLGLASVVSGAVPVSAASVHLDLPLMAAAALFCLPIVLSSRRVERWEGGTLLAVYVLYVMVLIVEAKADAGAIGISGYFVWGVLPAVFLLFALPLLRRAPALHDESTPS